MCYQYDHRYEWGCAYVAANGDVYDGYWLNDKKEGPGRFYYHASRKVYDGEWADDTPKCGTYSDSDEATVAEVGGDSNGASHRFQLPEVRACGWLSKPREPVLCGTLTRTVSL